MNKKPLLIGGLALLMGVSTLGGIAIKNKFMSTKADEYSFVSDSEPLKQIYSKGTGLTLPSGTIEYNGENLNVKSSYLIYPDGHAITKQKYILDQVGNYQAVFVATKGKNNVYAYVDFATLDTSFSVKNENSYVRYVDHLAANNVNLESAPSGVEIGLAEGDELTCNQVIDISNCTIGADSEPVIKFYTYSNSELAVLHGKREGIGIENTNYLVKITDFYNPSNYIAIQIAYFNCNPATGRMGMFAVAGGSNQSMTGLEKSGNTNVSIDGTGYKLHSGTNSFGANLTVCPGSKSCIDSKKTFSPDLHNTDRFGVSIYYEKESNRVYIADSGTVLVTDLDEPAIYPSSVFTGFTTGEVKVSISCSNYEEKLSHLEIENIYGIKGEQLAEQYIIDNDAPEITLSNNKDNFYIAKDEPFNISKAYVKDLNVLGDAKAEVIYEEGSSLQSNVSVNGDIFVPRKTGNYTIRYYATDAFGNKGTKDVHCLCVEAPNNHLVNLDTATIESFDAGSKVTLPTYNVNSLNGEEYCDIHVIFEDGSEEKVDQETRSFFAKRVGTYRIVYQYGDSVKDCVYSYEVTSNPSDNIYANDVYLPRYLIKDSLNSFDPVEIVTCSSKDQKIESPVVYVANDGNDYSSNPIDYDKYEVTASNSVKFKYVYSNKTVYESETIPVIDVGFKGQLQMGKYFDGDVSFISTASNTTFVTNASSGDTEINFINALSIRKFNLDISFLTKAFSSMDVIISDYYDRSITYKMSFSYDLANKLSVTINNNVKIDIGEQTNYSFAYNEKEQYFVDKYFNIVPIYADMFTSDRVYLSFVYHDMTAVNSLLVNTVGNQKITSRKVDNVEPEIVYENITGYYNIYDVVEIKPANAYDVLSPFYSENFTYSLTMGDKYLTALDGTLLNNPKDKTISYSAYLEEYGQYQSTFTYSDQAYTSKGVLSPNQISQSSYFTVEDREAPVISINKADSNTIDTGEYGKFISVRGYSVSDNKDSGNDIKVRIFAMNPYYEMLDITDDMGFDATYYGDYKIIYFASDSKGNISYASYYVRIK